MQLSRPLLEWYFRSAWFVTVPAMLLASAFALSFREQLDTAEYRPVFYIAIQSVLTTWAMSRFESPATAFLYTRGYTRDRLWVNRIATHLLCAIATWGPAALIVWLGLRSTFQDHYVQSPFYPLMRSADYAAPWQWLFWYLVLVGIVQYAPIRRAQPTADRDGGYAITFILLIAILALVYAPTNPSFLIVVLSSAIVISSVAMLIGGWRLHRDVEIRP